MHILINGANHHHPFIVNLSTGFDPALKTHEAFEKQHHMAHHIGAF